MNDELKYKIALTLIPNIGSVSAKTLISYCGSAEAVFKEKKSKLEKIPEIGPIRAKAIATQQVLKRAEKELLFIEKHKISPFFYLDSQYPARLRNCNDAPTMLYYKGTGLLNADKVIAVVGTRNASDYGLKMCEKIINGLVEYEVMILSGLAYGIDIAAHAVAMKLKLPTVAVLAHGLDRIYPRHHLQIARKMQERGGILTEFISETIPDKENFPSRNRIVAGMADALLVVESGARGGSLITAEIGLSYNRDVFAVPGRSGDMYSQGCNNLIKGNKAALVETADDIAFMMGWIKPNEERKEKSIQRKLFPELNTDEKILFDILSEHGACDIDTLGIKAGFSNGKTSSTLLGLEFAGVLRTLPGKIYELL